MKKIALFSMALFVVLSFSGCGDSQEAQTIVEDNGSFEELKKQSNKTYNLLTTEGKTITLKVENDILTSTDPLLKGKVVLLNFWATWCPPCKKEMPTLNRLYEMYQKDFVIIGILYEKNKNSQELSKFMSDYNMKFPVTVSEENFRMAKAFDDVRKIPESFMYGKDGKLLEKFVGEIPEEAIEKLIKSNL